MYNKCYYTQIRLYCKNNIFVSSASTPYDLKTSIFPSNIYSFIIDVVKREFVQFPKLGVLLKEPNFLEGSDDFILIQTRLLDIYLEQKN